MNDLCNQMSNVNIIYDERKELIETMKIELRDIDIKKVDERYTRYLNGINLWEIDGFSYENIRENINLYFSIDIFNKKIHLIKIIDKQLIEMLEMFLS